MISERIKFIQERCLELGKSGKASHFDYDLHFSANNIYNDLPHGEKLAKSMSYAIANQDIWVYDYDNIGGRIFYNHEKPVDNLCPELDYVSSAYAKLKNEIECYDELVDNQLISILSDGKSLWCNGHISWNYNLILEYGVEGLKDKFLKALEFNDDLNKKEFYQGVIHLLDSLLEFNDKHVDEYIKLGNSELASRMKRVPRYPSLSFKDAVQAFYMQHIVVMRENPFGGNSPGRLDYFLWPYLKRDLDNSIITLEEAKEVIDELFLRIEERLYHYDSWSETIVVGGTNKDGKSAVNPLTYIMVESIIDLKIIHPSLYIRLPENPAKELLELCSKYMISGCNRSQILYDPSIIEAMVKGGIEKEDAINYFCGGCMEIGVQGKNCDFLYGGWQNTAKMLELMITGGISLKTKKRLKSFKMNKGLQNYLTFEEFYNDFIKEAKRLIHLSLYEMDVFNELAAINRPSYLLSSMIDNCLKTGKNLNDGGAKYHDYGSTPMALPDTIDSLYAIKWAIFDKKICDSSELIKALNNNFLGYEKLQSTLKTIPKYGMDDLEVDEFANKVMIDFADIYHSYKTRHGGKGKPIILTFIHAPAASSILGATASGRNANSLIAHGVTPNSNSMTEGITAAINSCCKLPFNEFSGGASTMWDFDSSWVSEEIVRAIIKTFIDNGGQIFQGNTTNVCDLIRAKNNPNEYENLFVRVGGYSARFINLSPSLQEEIISRIRHRS